MNDTRSDFENAVSVLLPVDPFIKKKLTKDSTRNNPGAIAQTSGSTFAFADSGSNTGVSGVKLQFHTDAQYRKLTPAQKTELHKWRNTPEGTRYSENEKKKRKQSSTTSSTCPHSDK